MNRKPENNSAGTVSTVKVLRSEELFSGGREILIEHNRDYYRLMITKGGKLILNK